MNIGMNPNQQQQQVRIIMPQVTTQQVFDIIMLVGDMVATAVGLIAAGKQVKNMIASKRGK